MGAVATVPSDCPPALVASVQRALKRSGEHAPFSLRCDGRLVRLDLHDDRPVTAELTTPGLDEPWVAAALSRIVDIERHAASTTKGRTDALPATTMPEEAASTAPVVAAALVPEPPRPRVEPDAAVDPLPASPTRNASVSYELRLHGQSMAVGPWAPGLEVVRRKGAWEQGLSATAAWLATPAGILRAQQVGWTVGRPWATARRYRTEVEWTPRLHAGLVALSSVPGPGARGAPSTLAPLGSLGMDLALRLRTKSASAFALGARASVGAGPVATVDGQRRLSFQGV
ncbi:MAG: hypothetical protein RL199_1138, partial [Pseudomonadota bacterium]